MIMASVRRCVSVRMGRVAILVAVGLMLAIGAGSAEAAADNYTLDYAPGFPVQVFGGVWSRDFLQTFPRCR
jgi:hypothetical protein